MPGVGKSTAAALSLAHNCTGKFTGLAVVPSSSLVDQYTAQLQRWGVDSKALYRTGDVESDEQQLKDLQGGAQVVVCTPTRLLDYLTYDASLVPVAGLKQLVVDELELFQSASAKPTPLEQLLQHICSNSSPTLTLIANTLHRLSFKGMQELLVEEDKKREVVEVSEAAGPLDVRLRVLRSSGEEMPLDKQYLFPRSVPLTSNTDVCARALLNVWDGNSLIIVPDGVSSEKLTEACSMSSSQATNSGIPEDSRSPVIVKLSEISGININLDNLLVLGWQSGFDLQKLAYMLRPGGKLTVCLPTDNNEALQEIYGAGLAPISR